MKKVFLSLKQFFFCKYNKKFGVNKIQLILLRRSTCYDVYVQLHVMTNNYCVIRTQKNIKMTYLDG